MREPFSEPTRISASVQQAYSLGMTLHPPVRLKRPKLRAIRKPNHHLKPFIFTFTFARISSSRLYSLHGRPYIHSRATPLTVSHTAVQPPRTETDTVSKRPAKRSEAAHSGISAQSTFDMGRTQPHHCRHRIMFISDQAANFFFFFFFLSRLFRCSAPITSAAT